MIRVFWIGILNINLKDRFFLVICIQVFELIKKILMKQPDKVKLIYAMFWRNYEIDEE